MQCTMCGREIKNPEANFCDYCGTAVRDEVYREVRVEPQKTEEPKKDRVSTWLFLGVMCLPFVPIIGSFGYLGILLYWAFAPSIRDSKKSFGRAMLIYTVISLVLTIALLAMMFSLNTMTGTTPGVL